MRDIHAHKRATIMAHLPGNHPADLNKRPPLLRTRILRITIVLFSLLHSIRAGTVVARCDQSAATPPVTAHHLGEEEAYANGNLLYSVKVPPSVRHSMDTEVGLMKFLDWERLQHTIQEIASLSDIPNGVERAALYGVLHDKLQRLRERLADGFQGSNSSASVTLPVQNILCSEQPNAPGCFGKVSSGTQDPLVHHVSRTSFDERDADRAAADWILKFPYEGVSSSLPVQIQEQIQKNLEIEQVILEHKLLMQQLALNKQIEEFRREIDFEEWLDFWNQLGPQVYDQPVPEDTSDDTESSELLERLASRYPQLFEDQAFVTLPSQSHASTTAQTAPLSAEVGTQEEDSGGLWEGRRSSLRFPVKLQAHQESSSPEAHSREYGYVQNPLVHVKHSESEKGFPGTGVNPSVVPAATYMSAVDQAQNIERFVQQPVARPQVGSAKGKFEFQPSSSPPFHSTPIHTPRTTEDISLKAMEYTGKKLLPASSVPSLRGVLSDSRSATTDQLADYKLDQKSPMVPPAGVGTVGLLDTPSLGRNYESVSRERENAERQETVKTGPLLNLIKALRDMLAVN